MISRSACLDAGLLDPVDSGDLDAVQRALASVREEVDHGVAAGSTADADLVVVVREVGELEADASNALSEVAALGPPYGVRVLVASEHSVADMLERSDNPHRTGRDRSSGSPVSSCSILLSCSASQVLLWLPPCLRYEVPRDSCGCCSSTFHANCSRKSLKQAAMRSILVPDRATSVRCRWLAAPRRRSP
jgi:hypothetical protein